MKAIGIIRNQPLQMDMHPFVTLHQQVYPEGVLMGIEQPSPTISKPHIIDKRKNRNFSIQQQCIGNFKSYPKSSSSKVSAKRQLPQANNQIDNKIEQQIKSDSNIKRKLIFRNKPEIQQKKLQQNTSSIKQDKESILNENNSHNVSSICDQVVSNISKNTESKHTIQLSQSYQQVSQTTSQYKMNSKPRVNKQTGQPYHILITNFNNQNKSIHEDFQVSLGHSSRHQRIKTENYKRTPIFKKTQKKQEYKECQNPDYNKTFHKNKIFQHKKQSENQSIKQENISYLKPQTPKIHPLRPKGYSQNSKISRSRNSNYQQYIFQSNSHISSQNSINSSISIEVYRFDPMQPFAI